MDDSVVTIRTGTGGGGTEGEGGSAGMLSSKLPLSGGPHRHIPAIRSQELPANVWHCAPAFPALSGAPTITAALKRDKDKMRGGGNEQSRIICLGHEKMDEHMDVTPLNTVGKHHL